MHESLYAGFITIIPAYSLGEFDVVGVLVSLDGKMDIEGDIAVFLVAVVVEVLVCVYVVSVGATVPLVVGIDPKKFVTIDLTYINDYMAFQFPD